MYLYIILFISAIVSPKNLAASVFVEVTERACLNILSLRIYGSDFHIGIPATLPLKSLEDISKFKDIRSSREREPNITSNSSVIFFSCLNFL